MTPECLTPDQACSRIAARFGAGAVSDSSYGTVTADVAPQRWTEALAFARDELGCDTFGWLSAVDEFTDGLAIIAHVRGADAGLHLLLRTRVSGDPPRLPSAASVYRAAGGQERETAELFGIRFDGHPHPPPTPLLPDEASPPP